MVANALHGFFYLHLTNTNTHSMPSTFFTLLAIIVAVFWVYLYAPNWKVGHVSGFLGRLTSNESYWKAISYLANPSKYFHHQKEDACFSVGLSSDCHSGEFESDDDNVSDVPSTQKDDKSDDDDDGYYDSDDDDDGHLGIENVAKGTIIERTYHFFENSEDEENILKTMNPGPLLDMTMYLVNIFGYYSKSEGYGGYGIILYKDTYRTPVGAYCGVSSGGSHLYHLLDGVRKALQIASDRRLPRVQLSINSRRAIFYFNTYFRSPRSQTTFFHSNHDVAQLNFCNQCLTGRMRLSAEGIKLLVPVFGAIVKLQLETKFRNNLACRLLRTDAARYLEELGAEALEKKMKLGVGLDEVQVEGEMKMEELPEWLRTGKSEEKLPKMSDQNCITGDMLGYFEYLV